MKKNFKTTLAAIAFLASTSIIPTHAQINLLEPLQRVDTNLLLATTGPNTVGGGRLQVGATADGMMNRLVTSGVNTTTYGSLIAILGGNTSLRFGIGDRLELKAVFATSRGAFFEYTDPQLHTRKKIDMRGAEGMLGAKMLLMEGGRGWLPQVALAAQFGMQRNHGTIYNRDTSYSRFLGGAELQMRNRLGHRWVLDYSIGIGHPYSLDIRTERTLFDYSLMARWLATDRLLVGFGIDNGYGRAELTWQAAPALQLRAAAGLSIGEGLGFIDQIVDANATLGVSWMIK